MGELVMLDPRRLRREGLVDVDLGDGTFVKCRREDMTTLVFEGRVPMQMLMAIQKMVDMPNASPAERVNALGADHGKQLIDLLKLHATKVTLAPKLVLVDDGNPDHLPVDFLDVPKLMAIWNATATVPRVGPMAAATFRPEGDLVPPAPVADVPDVPPAPEPVAVAEPVVIERIISR
jgi:hypothetical protein